MFLTGSRCLLCFRILFLSFQSSLEFFVRGSVSLLLFHCIIFGACSQKKRKCRRSSLIDRRVSEHLEGFWHCIANRSEFLTFFCFSSAKLYCRHTAQCGVLSVLELSRTALSNLALVM